MTPPNLDDRDTLKALEALERKSQGGRPAAVGARFRCLRCGYPLMAESGFRCAECGATFTPAVLERWFGGAERERLERVGWLVRTAVVLKLAPLLGLIGYSWTPLLEIAYCFSLVAGGWAALCAGLGRFRTIGGYYAIAGLHVAALAAFLALREAFGELGAYPNAWLASLSALDAWLAALIVLAIAHPTHELTLPTARWSVRMAFGLLLLAPLLTVVYGAPGSPLNPSAYKLPQIAYLVLAWLMPHAGAVGAWLWAAWRIRLLRRTLTPDVGLAGPTSPS